MPLDHYKLNALADGAARLAERMDGFHEASFTKGGRNTGITNSLLDVKRSDAETVTVGQFVKIPFATLHGIKKQRAKVTRIMSDGLVEVKGVTDGGYYKFSVGELEKE